MGKHKKTECTNPLELEKYEQRKAFLKQVAEYRQSLRQYIMTSRFNNQTLQENRDFIRRTAVLKCVYCCPDPIAKNIPIDAILFVLEMNNDTNKIAGIGLVRNHAFMHKYNVYSERNYNRYIYYGKNHIAREYMTEEEERIMKVFDILCFTGNKHMKRGQGMKAFPIETLYKCKKTLDLVGFIAEMFKTRMSKKDANTL
jgi:hypothetical protein